MERLERTSHQGAGWGFLAVVLLALVMPISAADNFLVTASTSQTAGNGFTVTVTARNGTSTDTAYTGTVHITSTDTEATLPADATLTNGVGLFSVTLVTAGTWSVAATDTVTSSLTNSQSGIVVAPGAADWFMVSSLTNPTIAGVAYTVTVTARDIFGNIATGYAGTVQITSSDGSAVLPSSSALISGTKDFNVTLKTAGSQSITATDTVTASITGTQWSITVDPAAAASLTVSGFTTPTTAGIQHAVTVTAKDTFGNTATGYAGTVQVTSSDGLAVLPASSTLTNGTQSFNVTLKTAGSQSITATDTVSASITGNQNAITVTAAAANRLALITAPASATAGSLFSPQPVIHIEDAFGNLVNDNTTDVTAGLTTGVGGQFKGNKTVQASAGVVTFTDLHHDKAESIVIQFTSSPSLTAVPTASIPVSAGAAASIAVTGFPASPTAGTAGSVTVTVLDSNSNPATGYTGTVHFTSTDGAATLPANYTFAGGDAGVHTFTNAVTLTTAGSRSITATDTVNPPITGTQSGITVIAAAAATLQVSGLGTPRTAGTAGSLTVRARDTYGNIATSYLGTVHLTSGDGQAVLPSDYAFQASDNGVVTFTGGVILKTAGSWTVTATDTVSAAITGAQSGITVNPAAASTLVVSGLAASQTAGASGSVTVTARDPYGNTATGYLGTVHFTSSDAQATLPANHTFTVGEAGVRTFTNGVVLKTVGTQSVAATDTVTATITGSQGGIAVTPAAVTGFSVSGFPASPVAGTTGTVTVSARDQFGNPVTGYVGTVTFSSSDAQAILPANYTFVVGDNGTHAFSGGVTLKTAGTRSISATDTVTSSITGSQTGISVSPATAVALVFTQQPGGATAGSAFTQQPYLRSEDTYGNASTSGLGATVTVTMTLFSGSGTLLGFTTRNIGTVSPDFATGIAHFTTLQLNDASDAKVLRASATLNASPVQVDSSSFTVSPATTHHLVVLGAGPITAGVGAVLTLRAEDAFGNLATTFTQSLAVDLAGVPDGSNGEVSTFTDQSGTARAVVGGTTASLAFVGGIAGTGQDPDQCTLVAMPVGTWSITATGGSLIAGTALSMTVDAGAARKLTVTAVGTTAPVAGDPNTISVAVQDVGGNTVNTASQVDLLLSSAPTPTSLQAGATGTTIAAGTNSTTIANVRLARAETSVVITIADAANVLTAANTSALIVYNDKPVLTLPGTALTYTGASGAVPIGLPDIAVSDVHCVGFAPYYAGAKVTVSISSGLVAGEDVLQVRSAGVVQVSGTTVSYKSNPVATALGGLAGSALTVTFFGANAAPDAVQAVLDNLCYRNLAGVSPTVGPRTIALDFNDGSTLVPGGAKDALQVSRVVNVVVGNALPVLVANTGLSVVRGSTTAFNTANLQVTDEESGPSALIYTISTFPVEGSLLLGSGPSPVVLSPTGTKTFTQADIDAGHLAYRHSNSSQPGDTFSVIITDGTNFLTPTTVTIIVPGAASNPRLVLPNITTSLSWTENGPPAVIMPGAPYDYANFTQVIDSDSFNYDNGTLTIEIVDAANQPTYQPEDRLSLRSQSVGGLPQWPTYVPDVDYSGFIGVIGNTIAYRQYPFYYYWGNSYFGLPYPGGLPFPSLSPPTSYTVAWYPNPSAPIVLPLDNILATIDGTANGQGKALQLNLASGIGALGDPTVSAQAVGRLIDNLQYSSVSRNPTTASRRLRITLTEAGATGVGVVSLPLTITPVNNPPVFAVPLSGTSLDIEGVAGVPSRVRVVADDVDLPTGGSLVYSLTSISPPSAGVATINPSSGAIAFTPLSGTSGLATLTVRAIDDQGASDTIQVRVNVLAGPTDQGPMVVSDPPFETFEAQPLTYVMTIRPDPALGSVPPNSVNIDLVGDVPPGATAPKVGWIDDLHPVLTAFAVERPVDGVYTFGIRVEIDYGGVIGKKIGYQPVTFKVRAMGATN